MTPESLILCGPVTAPPKGAETKGIKLSAWESRGNVHLRISDLSRRLVANLPDRIDDLLDIAAYVYCADQALSRGGKILKDDGAGWRRSLRFVIAVRDSEFWSAQSELLAETLGFLSDDRYQFAFEKGERPPKRQYHFEYPAQNKEKEAFNADEVILFSGGLDSLAGAFEEMESGGKIALVSHVSSTKIGKAQRQLVSQLQKQGAPGSLWHIPVVAHKKGFPDVQQTQRSRSFLFAALAFATARAFDLHRVRFYENGIVSLNLPIADHVLGARATRTTHPKVLAGFANLFSQISERPFTVENPFFWKTKADVVRVISNAGGSHLIEAAVSCTRTRGRSREKTHCGVCSQCLSRRFAIVAANCAKHDPEARYEVPLFIGSRPAGEVRLMADLFVGLTSEIERMSDGEFVSRFAEIWRATEHLEGEDANAAARIVGLHRRHAREVQEALDSGAKQHLNALMRGELDPSCILMLSANRSSRELGTAPAVAPPPVPQPPESLIPAEIRIAIDEKRRRVVVEGLGNLTGAHFELIRELAELHVQSLQSQLAPENFPFFRRRSLAKRLELPVDTLDRRVSRLRELLRKRARERNGADHRPPRLIDGLKHKGWRLAPSTKILQLSEIAAAPGPDSKSGVPRSGPDSLGGTSEIRASEAPSGPDNLSDPS